MFTDTTLCIFRQTTQAVQPSVFLDKQLSTTLCIFRLATQTVQPYVLLDGQPRQYSPIYF